MVGRYVIDGAVPGMGLLFSVHVTTPVDELIASMVKVIAAPSSGAGLDTKILFVIAMRILLHIPPSGMLGSYDVKKPMIDGMI
jgi:hypothetical protein